MSIETEKKYKLPEELRLPLVDRLKEMGGEDHGEEFEENIIYGGGVLDEKGAVLRIRKTAGRTLLTYKQRIANDSQYKEQVEYETEFKGITALREILYNLGYRPRLIYEKQRHTWKFRKVEVVLDKLPFGNYMEIEGSITGIAEAEMLLDIEDLETEQETYPRLTARLGEIVNGIREARFPEKADKTTR